MFLFFLQLMIGILVDVFFCFSVDDWQTCGCLNDFVCRWLTDLLRFEFVFERERQRIDDCMTC